MPGIEVRRVDPSTMLCLDRRGPLSEMASAFSDLREAVGAADARALGPAVATYFDAETPFDRSNVRYRVCLPVPQTTANPAPPAYLETSRAGKVAVYTHRGEYEDLRMGYEILVRWISEQGYIINGPPREVYLTSPHHTDDPTKFVTEIHLPIESP